jgi:hypothetical protein
MPQDVPALTDDQRTAIAQVLYAWGEAHPNRHRPLIRLADGSELTPWDIGRAVVEPHSENGELIYRVFAYALIEDEFDRGRSLEEILQVYVRDLQEWRPPTRGL